MEWNNIKIVLHFFMSYMKITQDFFCLQLPISTTMMLCSLQLSGINLLYSSGNTSSVLHQDSLENILTIISGRKTVLAIHPTKYSHQLYVNQFTVYPGRSSGMITLLYLTYYKR